jgi:gluconolactonase
LPGYNTAYDISPHAGEAGFDDSKWPAIEPKDLAARRSGGHVAFIWFRTNLTIPAKSAISTPPGAKAVLTVLVDDYAEVWVNGQLPRQSGYPSPRTIQGLNLPNRVVLADAVKAGDKFQIAVFGINGPISVAPANTVWFASAAGVLQVGFACVIDAARNHLRRTVSSGRDVDDESVETPSRAASPSDASRVTR